MNIFFILRLIGFLGFCMCICGNIFINSGKIVGKAIVGMGLILILGAVIVTKVVLTI